MMKKTLAIALLAIVAATGAAHADSNRYNNPYGTDSNSPHLRDSQGKFLGNLNSNRYDPNSVANPYGQYGSRYSADSINNPYGQYGSRYSNESPHNPYGRGLSIYGDD